MLPDTKDPAESTSAESAEQNTEPADGSSTNASTDKAGSFADTASISAEEAVAAIQEAEHPTDGFDAADDPPNVADQPAADAEGVEADELSQLKSELAAVQLKADEHWDRLVRLQAEMENQRKRAQNDVGKARKFALEGIVGDLLPVKDSLEMGIAAAQAEDADPKSIAEGAELTLKMLGQVFEKNNIVEVNPVDEKFDPEFHQAMSMQEIEGKQPNTVASVMQKGYTLNERLVRPALVMVAK